MTFPANKPGRNCPATTTRQGEGLRVSPLELSGRALSIWKYNHSAKRHACNARYRKTAKQLEAYKRYSRSDKGVVRSKRYRESEGCKLMKHLFRWTPEQKLRARLYDQARYGH